MQILPDIIPFNHKKETKKAIDTKKDREREREYDDTYNAEVFDNFVFGRERPPMPTLDMTAKKERGKDGKVEYFSFSLDLPPLVNHLFRPPSLSLPYLSPGKKRNFHIKRGKKFGTLAHKFAGIIHGPVGGGKDLNLG